MDLPLQSVVGHLWGLLYLKSISSEYYFSDINLVPVLKGGVKYGEIICNIHQCCNIDYYVYLFVIVIIKRYIGILKAVSCQIEMVWTAQSINNNNNYVNNSHNCLFSLFMSMCSFHICIMIVFSCNGSCCDEPETTHYSE